MTNAMMSAPRGPIRIEREPSMSGVTQRTDFADRKIFDFGVFIDGERRATWTNSAPLSSGYVLRDLDRTVIKFPPAMDDKWARKAEVRAKRQADTAALTQRALDANLIPTGADIEQRREERRQRKIEADKKTYADAFAETIRAAGPRILEQLEAVCGAGGDLRADGIAEATAFCAVLRERAKADAEAAIQD